MSHVKIFRDIKGFEERLGLPAGFYARLLKEDDWSFVIKLNALFEGASTHALAARLHAPELIEQFASLEFADKDRGKVKFLSALGCITAEQAGILKKLAELRNGLVHNVSRITFTFEEHVRSLDSNQRSQLAKIFGHGWKDPIELAGKKIPRTKFFIENAKLMLWFTAAEVLATLHLEFEIAEIRLRTAALEEYKKMVDESVNGQGLPQ